MRTDDLISALAADARAEASSSLSQRALVSLGVGAAVTALAFLAMLGPRADLLAPATLAATAGKIAVTGAVALAGALAALRLVSPGAPVGRALWPLLAALVGLAIWGVWETAMLGAEGWRVRLVGSNASHCLMLAPLFALAPLAGFLAALRRGAPVRPARAGAAAGLASAGVGAAFYALNCTDDSPLFVFVWYSLATAIVMALGAAIGSRLLRW